MKESAPAVLERRTLGCSREDGEGGRALSASAGIRSLQLGYRAIVRGRVLLMGGEEVFRCTVPRGTPSRGGDLQYEYLMIGRVNHQAYFALSDVDVARRVFWRNSVVRHADGDGARPSYICPSESTESWTSSRAQQRRHRNGFRNAYHRYQVKDTRGFFEFLAS